VRVSTRGGSQFPSVLLQPLGQALRDGERRSIQIPTVVLYGDHEVNCDPTPALAWALRLIPDCQGIHFPCQIVVLAFVNLCPYKASLDRNRASDAE
jgi:hypothetical protein